MLVAVSRHHAEVDIYISQQASSYCWELHAAFTWNQVSFPEAVCFQTYTSAMGGIVSQISSVCALGRRCVTAARRTRTASSALCDCIVGQHQV